MSEEIVLASGSASRQEMLRKARVAFVAERPMVDEEALRRGLEADGVTPFDLSDALAEAKALRVSRRRPGKLVVGSDQVLEFEGRAIGKSSGPEALLSLLTELSGQTHALHSAAVLARDGVPIWRQVDTAKLTMRRLGTAYLRDYVERNWKDIRHTVGGYKIEEEGVRLFSRIEGDFFTILGMPLVPLLNQLVTIGAIEG